MRHNSFITRLPYRRPDRYHAVSPMKHAATAATQSALPDSRPSLASAPARIKVGITGTGKPS